jgi:hypothetical protein
LIFVCCALFVGSVELPVCRLLRDSLGRRDARVSVQAGQGAVRRRVNAVARWVAQGQSFVDSEVPASPGVDEAGGDVQEPVAQRCSFAACEVAVQAEGLRPGEQVRGGEGEFEPDLVLLVAAAGQVAYARCLLAADAVLDAGVGPVPCFEVGVADGADRCGRGCR